MTKKNTEPQNKIKNTVKYPKNHVSLLSVQKNSALFYKKSAFLGQLPTKSGVFALDTFGHILKKALQVPDNQQLLKSISGQILSKTVQRFGQKVSKMAKPCLLVIKQLQAVFQDLSKTVQFFEPKKVCFWPYFNDLSLFLGVSVLDAHQ